MGQTDEGRERDQATDAESAPFALSATPYTGEGTPPGRARPVEDVPGVTREALTDPEVVAIKRDQHIQLIVYRDGMAQIVRYLREMFPADVRSTEEQWANDAEPKVPLATRYILMCLDLIRRLWVTSGQVTQRSPDWNMLNNYERQLDLLATFFRERYSREIAAGAHNQFPDAATAAVHYLAIERDLTSRGIWGRLKYLLWGL